MIFWIRGTLYRHLVLQHNGEVVAVAVTTVFVAVKSAFRASAGVFVVAL